MKIKVRYFTTLRELAGTEEEELEMEDRGILAKLIKKVSSKYGEEAFEYLHDKSTGKIDPSIKILVNGVDVRHLQGIETKLEDGDVVAVIPPIGGG